MLKSTKEELLEELDDKEPVGIIRIDAINFNDEKNGTGYEFNHRDKVGDFIMLGPAFELLRDNSVDMIVLISPSYSEQTVLRLLSKIRKQIRKYGYLQHAKGEIEKAEKLTAELNHKEG